MSVKWERGGGKKRGKRDGPSVVSQFKPPMNIFLFHSSSKVKKKERCGVVCLRISVFLRGFGRATNARSFLMG